MEQLESLLNSGGLSDPFQLVPLLRDLTTDEHVFDDSEPCRAFAEAEYEK